MKLKTVPIVLSLDEVVIEMETCENYRNPSDKTTIKSDSRLVFRLCKLFKENHSNILIVSQENMVLLIVFSME